MKSLYVGQLGAVHQFRNVPYVETNGGTVRCMLCGTQWMYESARKMHFTSSRHLSNYEKAAKNRSIFLRKDIVERYKHRVSALGLAKWRHHVQSLMFDYLFTFTQEPIREPLLPPSEILSILNRYEQMERASLLELALRKAKLCDDTNGVSSSKSTLARGEYQAVLVPESVAKTTDTSPWKNGCSVIIPRVLQFM